MEFKRISDAELVQVSEETNLLVEVNGEVKRTASTEHMKVEKLKNLITKFGGNSEDVQSVDEALDRLCACEIGGGVSSWNDLTDKPFGEENVISEPLNITFDGTNGEEFVNGENSYFKISDRVLTDEEIKAVTCTTEYGSFSIGDVFDELKGSSGRVTEELVIVEYMMFFVRNGHAVIPGTNVVFPKVGIYVVMPCTLTKSETTFTKVNAIEGDYVYKPIIFTYDYDTTEVSCNLSINELFELSATEIKNRSACRDSNVGDEWYLTATTVSGCWRSDDRYIILTFENWGYSYDAENEVFLREHVYIMVTENGIKKCELVTEA